MKPSFIDRRAASLLILAAAGPRFAWAHRAHVSLARISANVRAGTWEIEHQLHHHDAEIALRQLPDGRRLQLASLEGQARMALYVDQHFLLFQPDRMRLSSRIVGAELDKNALAVFQECPAPSARGAYRVRNTILHREFSQQVNRTLVLLGAESQVLELTAASPEASFTVR